jgi:hypothetical protein
MLADVEAVLLKAATVESPVPRIAAMAFTKVE